jgi:hypothetical protein
MSGVELADQVMVVDALDEDAEGLLSVEGSAPAQLCCRPDLGKASLTTRQSGPTVEHRNRWRRM